LSPNASNSHVPFRRLPLAILYVTDRCNSRCITCDYWRNGRTDLTYESVQRLLPDLEQLETKVVLISGGEPLLNPEWAAIAKLLRENGLAVWLLTSGLSLSKHARRAAALFQSITVSLDGTDAQTYAAIRGLDAFDKVCEGIRAVADLGVAPGIRVTLQRANYRQLSGFVDLGKELGAREVSFLAVDVANPHAFGRTDGYEVDLALSLQDLPIFGQLIERLERDHSEDFQSRFIAESPPKLRRILQYFAAIHGQDAYPQVRCNAPEFSAVIGASHQVQPCFFIRGPPTARLRTNGIDTGMELPAVLNGAAMVQLRDDIRSGLRAECTTCVCSMWRDSKGDGDGPALYAAGSG
jgi:Fe-coproporphyrin III synthase